MKIQQQVLTWGIVGSLAGCVVYKIGKDLLINSNLKGVAYWKEYILNPGLFIGFMVGTRGYCPVFQPEFKPNLDQSSNL